MYHDEIEKEVDELFRGLTEEAHKIAKTSPTAKYATEQISAMVAAKVSAECEGFIIDIYSDLVDEIKKDEFFKDPEHLKAFYRLNIREQLNEKYQFEITSLDAYKKGIEFKEINNLYAAAGAAAGTLAVGGILKFAISGALNIPLAIIIAGAVIVGIAAYLTVPTKNRNDYIKAVDQYLNDLKNEILDWLNDIDVYMQEQVRTLYKE